MSKTQNTDLFGEVADKAERGRKKQLERFVKRYQTDSAFREKHKARNRAAYQNDPIEREKKKQQARAYYLRHRGSEKASAAKKRAQAKAKARYHTDPEYRANYLARRRGKPKFKTQEQRDAYNAKMRELRRTDDTMRKRVRDSHIRWHTQNRIVALTRRCVNRARKAGIPYDEGWMQTVAELRPERCPCCKEVLDYSFGLVNGDRRKPNWRVPSIDRLVPSLGYVRGNVDIICRRCNALKRDASLREIENIAAYLRSRLDGLDS